MLLIILWTRSVFSFPAVFSKLQGCTCVYCMRCKRLTLVANFAVVTWGLWQPRPQPVLADHVIFWLVVKWLWNVTNIILGAKSVQLHKDTLLLHTNGFFYAESACLLLNYSHCLMHGCACHTSERCDQGHLWCDSHLGEAFTATWWSNCWWLDVVWRPESSMSHRVCEWLGNRTVPHWL